MSYPNKQSEQSNWNGYQLITRKRGNSNFLDFNEVYSLYRFTQKFCIKQFSLFKYLIYQDKSIPIFPYSSATSQQ